MTEIEKILSGKSFDYLQGFSDGFSYAGKVLEIEIPKLSKKVEPKQLKLNLYDESKHSKESWSQ